LALVKQGSTSMGDLAAKRMTLAEFLVWDDGTDTRYELVGGEPRAMAPAYPRHGLIQRNAGRVIEARIGLGGSCRVYDQAGVVLSVLGDDRYYVPDLVMSCEALGDELFLQEPKLIVEVLSPSTGRDDKAVKVPHYCALPTVEEVWLIDSQTALVFVWQKRSGQWIGSLPLQLGQRFSSELLGGEIAVDDLFLGTGLDAPDAQPSSGQS
jgi:Uma2 family endonuclease